MFPHGLVVAGDAAEGGIISRISTSPQPAA
jgi:hypothetical protein